MKRRAFSVVEAVLVVFTVVLLAILLYPVFFYPRPKPPRSPCQQRLKQIALACRQYAVDWDDHLPLTAQSHSTVYGWADALVPYTGSARLFQCEGETRQGKGNWTPWEDGYTDYYYNGRLSGVSQSHIPFAANTILLGEGNDGTEQCDARYDHDSVPERWIRNAQSPLRRHRAGSNYAFVDGYVK